DRGIERLAVAAHHLVEREAGQPALRAVVCDHVHMIAVDLEVGLQQRSVGTNVLVDEQHARSVRQEVARRRGRAPLAIIFLIDGPGVVWYWTVTLAVAVRL